MFRYCMVIPDLFSNPTHLVQDRRVYAYIFEVVFAQHFFLKYGVTHNVQSNNGIQFASQIFELLFHLFVDSNFLTSEYNSHSNVYS